MSIIKSSLRFNAIVDPTRIKGNRRVFKNVIAATTAGMNYNPADHDLLIVHEPGTGYRAIALDAVVSLEPVRRVVGRNAQAKRVPNLNLSNLSWLRGKK